MVLPGKALNHGPASPPTAGAGSNDKFVFNSAAGVDRLSSNVHLHVTLDNDEGLSGLPELVTDDNSVDDREPARDSLTSCSGCAGCLAKVCSQVEQERKPLDF